MNTFRKTCALLIIGFVAIYTIGCGDVTTQLEPEDPEAVDETITTDEDKAPIQTDGRPITVTDETFDTVVLEAEMPVVVELRAEW